MELLYARNFLLERCSDHMFIGTFWIILRNKTLGKSLVFIFWGSMYILFFAFNPAGKCIYGLYTVYTVYTSQ